MSTFSSLQQGTGTPEANFHAPPRIHSPSLSNNSPLHTIKLRKHLPNGKYLVKEEWGAGATRDTTRYLARQDGSEKGTAANASLPSLGARAKMYQQKESVPSMPIAASPTRHQDEDQDASPPPFTTQDEWLASLDGRLTSHSGTSSSRRGKRKDFGNGTQSPSSQIFSPAKNRRRPSLTTIQQEEKERQNRLNQHNSSIAAGRTNLYLDLIQDEDITQEDLINDSPQHSRRQNGHNSSGLLARRAASSLRPPQMSKKSQSTSLGDLPPPSRSIAKSVSPSIMNRVQSPAVSMLASSPLNKHNRKRNSISSVTSQQSGDTNGHASGRRIAQSTPKRLAPLTSPSPQGRSTTPLQGRSKPPLNHHHPLSAANRGTYEAEDTMHDDESLTPHSGRRHLSPMSHSPRDLASPSSPNLSPSRSKALITKPKKSLPTHFEELLTPLSQSSHAPSSSLYNTPTHHDTTHSPQSVASMLSPSMVSISGLASPHANATSFPNARRSEHVSQAVSQSHNSSYSTLPVFNRQPSANPRYSGISVTGSPSQRGMSALARPSSTIIPRLDYSRSTTHNYRHFITQFHEKFLPFQSHLKHSLYTILQDVMQQHDYYLRDEKNNDEQLRQIEQFLAQYRNDLSLAGEDSSSEALYMLICGIVDLLPLPHIVNILESRKKRLGEKPQAATSQGQPDVPFASFHNFDPAGKDSVLFFALCCQAFMEPNVVARSALCMKYIFDCIQFDDHQLSKPPQDMMETLDTSTIPLQPLSAPHLFFLFTSLHMLLLSMIESEHQHDKDIEYILFPKCMRIIVSCSTQSQRNGKTSSDYLILRPVLSVMDILFDHYEVYRMQYLRTDPQLQHLIHLLQSHGAGQNNTTSHMLCVLSTQKLAFKLLFRYMKDTQSLRAVSGSPNVHNKRNRQQLQTTRYLTIVKALLERTQYFLYNFCNVGSGTTGGNQLSSKLASEVIVQTVWNTSDDFLVALLGFLQDMVSILYDTTFVIPVSIVAGNSPNMKKHADVQRLQPPTELSQLQGMILSHLRPEYIMTALTGMSQVSRRALLAYQREINANVKDEEEYDDDDKSDLFDGTRGDETQRTNNKENEEESPTQDPDEELLSPRDEQSTSARVSHCTTILNMVFACLQNYSTQKEFTPFLLQLGIVREVKFALKRLQYCHDAVRILLNLCMHDNFTTTKLASDERNFFRVIVDCAVESFDTKTGSFFLLKIIEQILCGFSSHKLSQSLTTKFRIHEYKLVRAQIMHEIRVFFVHHYLETRLTTYEILHKVGCLESPLTKTIHRQLKKQENSLCKFLARGVSPQHIVTTRALLLLFSTPGVNLKRWVKFDHALFNLNKPYVTHFAVCDACGVFHSEEKPLQLCSQCQARMYCSKRCQEMHYEVHRKYCNPSRKPEYEKWVILVKDHSTRLGHIGG